ncbi:MraY family glycosyltransferase [Maribacter sp. TH_r10]|uniref:MraY family glycosyltransferase n=1 Tax=Maribacter sp. TH_r10 TaxID=3082086 RepID=UPI002955B8A5|nr:MraY family glycosyltransferase [Maribacter sp. TH_r10]MDV7140134.1 MraY family glycosyltransferase [Maribacter sp. TH_r10]
MDYLIDLFSNIYVLAGLSVIVAFLSSIRMFPVIIYIVRTKNIMDEPGGRKVHSEKIPTFGGVGLFASFALAIILFGMSIGLEHKDLIKLLSLLAATILLLFMGIKDDLIAIPPKKKLSSQLIASGIVIFMTDVRIMDFQGLFGIGELPYLVSVLFTFFVFILVINAFNLIDGIDGLAGSIALIGSCTLGIFFLQNDQSLLALVSFVLIGSLLGFLRFNLSKSRSKKLFMGDSGSMFIGFLLAYLGISFLAVNASVNIPMPTTNAPILLLTILSFPLLDTLRVFIIRLSEKRSPFSPDRNHIHHRLLNLDMSHRKSTLFIVNSNWLVIGTAFMVQDLNINLQLVICLMMMVVLYLSPYLPFVESFLRQKVSKKKDLLIKLNGNDIKNEVPETKGSLEPDLECEITENENSEVLKVANSNINYSKEKDSELQKIIDKRASILKKTTVLE